MIATSISSNARQATAGPAQRARALIPFLMRRLPAAGALASACAAGLIAGAMPCRASGPAGTIVTVAGIGQPDLDGDGGPAAAANLLNPQGIVMDPAGNLYIVEESAHRVRKVAPDGTITTFAGTGQAGFSGDSGPAARASLNYPGALATDVKGNLFISDYGNHRIREVTPDGIIRTVAGTGVRGDQGDDNGDGGPAIGARLYAVTGMAVDPSGNLYLTDGMRVRKVGTNGIVTTIAGSSSCGFSGDGGPASTATFCFPRGLATDSAGDLFVADEGDDRIRKIAQDDTISTVAGDGQMVFSAPSGRATKVSLGGPVAVAAAPGGDLFIADSGGRVWRVRPDGTIDSIAGNGLPTYAGDGGPASQASLHDPTALALGLAGQLYVADSKNNRVRAILPDGTITTVAGGGPGGIGDGGKALRAALAGPEGVAIDAAGGLVIADTGDERIRRVDAGGVIQTVAGGSGGSLAGGFGGDGGPATAAALYYPAAVAAAADGSLFIADSINRRVRRVGPDGVISTVAGTGPTGGGGALPAGDGGPATRAVLSGVGAVALDPAGDLFILDDTEGEVRKVAPDGTITTVAGMIRCPACDHYSGDGEPATKAVFYFPAGLAVDPPGDLFVADTYNDRVREVGPDGMIDTVAGTGPTGASSGGPPPGGYSGDGGPASLAQLSLPAGLALDSAGDLFIADWLNHVVREVTPNGNIKTVAGNNTQGFAGDGGPATAAELNSPMGVAIDAAGNLFIADTENNRVREVFGAASPGLIGGRPFPPTAAPMRGDVNGDGSVTVGDATLALRIALQLVTPTSAERLAADVNGDGEVTVADATLILRGALGL